MKTKLLLIVLAIIVGIGTIFASDIQVNGIWYNFNISDSTAEVTYRGSSFDSYQNNYAGTVVIPMSVIYEDISYNVTSIGKHAFYGCNNLTTVDISNNITKINLQAFAYCSKLHSVKLSDNLSIIGEWAFALCTSLHSIDIPESVTRIEGTAFGGCSSLSSIIIPSNVQMIGGYAFDACQFSSITCKAITPPSIDNITFRDVDKSTPLYVPMQSVGTYKVANGWKDFINILAIPNGSLTGTFSISASSKIRFSQGNLQYRASTDTWRFAEQQYDYIGNNIGNTTGDNREIQNSWIDLYGWGTGYNPTLCSSEYSDYENFIDWGTNMIINGDGNNWRTLTYDEWWYVFYTRKNANNLRGQATVNNVHGYILLPDNWGNPGELTFVPNPNNWTSNVYTATQWAVLEKAGAVFFPCAGSRTTTRFSDQVSGYYYPVNDVETRGNYWSATWFYNAMSAHSMNFEVSQAGVNAYNRPCGFSVRLVRDAEIFHVTLICNNDLWGYATGDTISVDDATITASPNYGYHFKQWSDGNLENPRYILLTQDTTFSAEFEKNQYEVQTASNYDFRGSTIGDTVAYYLDSIEVQAIPNYGYHFAYWLEHDQYSNPCKFAVTQNEMLTAVFEPNKYTISVSGDLEQGVVRGENGEYDYLSELHYEAIPNNGYYFTQWSDGSTDNPRTITLTKDTAFNAEFAVLPCEQYSFYYDTTIVACGEEYISWRRYEHIPADVPGTYHYYDSLHTITGCDSVYSLTLVVGSPSYMIYYDTITEGLFYYPIGIITESGIYRDTLRTMFGCDSIQEWHIHVLPALSGKCGDEAYWDLDTISGVLMISGNGAMYDYKSTTLPWRKYAQYITSAQVQEGITHLSAYAFENIRTLLNVHLPSTLETMGNMSFYCAANIGTITCDAIIPPTGGTFKGVNRDAIIYVPCGTKGAYTNSNNWGWYFPNIEDGTYEFIEDTLICYGADLNWRGQYHLPYYSDTVIYYNDNSTLYKFGGVQAIFPDSLKTMQGCDSVYVLNAYIAPHYYEIIYDTINEGESHWAIHGDIQSDRVYYDRYATILGCDSVQEWHIHVKPTPRYNISVAANSSKYGSVEGAGTYKRDTTITLTAIPNKGYQFNEWSDGNTDNPRQITVTQDSTFTVIFGNKMCSWLVESNDLEMGAVVTSFNNEYYQYGTQITVEASPNSGYKFVKWNDGKKFNPYKFSILDDKYLLAIFMEEEGEQDTTTVQPSSTSATFTWPFIVGGFSYSLTIYLDVACTIPFCTITFNQYGQLIGISFGNRAPRRSMEQEDGFTYTVSGLDANTEYYFKMETMDEDNKLINTDEGAFRTTNEATGIENQYNTVIEHRKVMINGQIFILRGDKTYTLQGQEVK
jgi:hypothetical protein